MNALVSLCCSFDDCRADRVEVITAIGRLRRLGFERLEDFDSADAAETLLGKNGAVALVINRMIQQATSEGDARRDARKRNACKQSNVKVGGNNHTMYFILVFFNISCTSKQWACVWYAVQCNSCTGEVGHGGAEPSAA
jgi:hypothetical protein